MHRVLKPALFLTGAIVLLVLPRWLDSYSQYLVNLAMAYILVSLGLNLLLGYAGQFAFANAAFMGIGAYTFALLTTRLGWPFLLALPMSGLLAVILGIAIAMPALRMATVYLAMVSLAFAELVQWILIHWKAVTLGTDGVRVSWPAILGYSMRGDRSIYYIILAVSALGYWIAYRLIRSKHGRAFIAVRESETLARCSGINVEWVKTLAFALSAFYAGIGGGLFALALRFVVPDGFGLVQLVLQFSMVLIGGLGNLVGSVIGAIVLTALPELLRGVQAFQEILYGVLLVGFILFMPRGIAGLMIRFRLLQQEVLARGADAAFANRKSYLATPGSTKADAG
jgi:branched-chain amino acid transport system permease protein